MQKTLIYKSPLSSVNLMTINPLFPYYEKDKRIREVDNGYFATKGTSLE
jgi:hypothetical protein